MSHSPLSNPESILSVLYEYLKRKHTLDVSFWSLSRIKLECMVRILSVSTRWMSYSVSIANQAYVYNCTNVKHEYTLHQSHSGLNRESSLSALHEY